MLTTILQLLKSRTVWFAVLLAVLSVVQGYLGRPATDSSGTVVGTQT